MVREVQELLAGQREAAFCSQKRLNILGALALEDMAIHTQEYETINGDAIIAFLSYLLSCLPGLTLHIILDQAGYHKCAAVKAWVEQNPRITLHLLPPYSPNLNTIERVRKIMHEHTVNNAYSPTFKTFTETIRSFFSYTFPKSAPLSGAVAEKSWASRFAVIRPLCSLSVVFLKRRF
jgi:transposase